VASLFWNSSLTVQPASLPYRRINA